ncbi:MAG: PIN domain-containing protein [Fibrobacterota bacterium]
MKVIVDTCIWSLVFRRKGVADDPLARALSELVRDCRAQILGPIRQELLSGVKTHDFFTLLRDKLQAFPDQPLRASDYERAAEFCNYCRSKGVQGSATDFLICAVSAETRMPIFTTDNDFTLYRKHLPVYLFKV